MVYNHPGTTEEPGANANPTPYSASAPPQELPAPAVQP